METIIKDACMRELQLAYEACSEYVPLSAMQYYIEADEDPKIAEVKANNEKVKTNVMGHIKKAIQALRTAIGNMIRKVADMFSKASMDKKTKEAYEEYKKAVKANPSLAGKKLSATEFKDMEGTYQKVLKETEAAERDIIAGKHVDFEALKKKCEGYIAEVGKGTAAAVSAQTLLNMARGNQSIAAAISMGLNNSQEVMDALEKQLGKENAQNLNAEVAKLSGRCTLHRLKLRLFHQMARDNESSFELALKGLRDAVVPSLTPADSIKKIGGNSKEMNKLLRGNETIDKTLNARDEVVKTVTGEAIKDRVKAPIKAAQMNSAMKAEERREKRGDYSGADAATYVAHKIEAMKNRKK
jgi:hypothetical protein